jgi:hypothetical protein
VVSPGLDQPFALLGQAGTFFGHKRLELFVGPRDLPMTLASLAARKLAIDPKSFAGSDL